MRSAPMPLVRSMPLSISDLLKIPVIWAFDLEQNGRFVIYSSNETGVLQLYLLATELGSRPKQVTRGNDPVMEGAVSPQGDYLVYPQDKDGNEMHHLFLLPIEEGETKQLTKNPLRTLDVDWHPNGKEVTRAFVSATSSGLETCNLRTEECFVLKEPIRRITDLQYSHDGKWIAFTAAPGKNEQVFILNRNDPSDTVVYSISDDSKNTSPSWSPDDKKLAFVSDAKGIGQMVIQEFQGTERIFLKLEEGEGALLNSQASWDPEGDKVYYLVSKFSRTTVHGHQIYGEKETTLPFPEGTIELPPPQISKDGKVMVALHSSMTSPYGLYLYRIGSKSASLLTPRNYRVDLTQLVQPQSVWYESFDKRKIHGWYLPSATGTPPHPGVVYVHGGPWSQVFDYWFEGVFMHCLSQSGFAVFAPNFRGSSGYGAEFQDLDIGDPGGGDLEDVVTGSEWLLGQSEIDGSRIAIMGISYGGYMTLMALTKKPKVFAAGVSLVPNVDWVETYQLSDPSMRAYAETLLEGAPSKNETLYKDRSPITHISHIKAPVMIMAGQHDLHCPIEPIEKFVKKLKEMKHPHKFVIEEKAGHISALVKMEESIPLFSNIIDYLKNTLV